VQSILTEPQPALSVVRPRSFGRGTEPPPKPALPPFYPGPPVQSAPITPLTPIPNLPSMSTAMAFAMAQLPAIKAPSLHQAMAVPLGLPAPQPRTSLEWAVPVPSKWPLVIVAIVCALSGALAALMVA
jgi:hypothetical protein